jgi:transcriptional regulator GlxA family with amidase domain
MVKTRRRKAGPTNGERWPIADKPLRVVLLTTPDAQPLDVAGPYEVFSIAGRKLRELGDDRGRGYQIEILNLGKGRSVKGISGLTLFADGEYSSLKGTCDTLLIAGGMEPWQPAGQERIISWLRRQAPRARRVGAVCTGAFVLAAAGLLNGRRATTHWYFGSQLARQYPEVKVDTEPIFVRDGNIYTSAGVTAGMDLALALVEEDFGSEVAIRIARAYVMFLRRPGGQSQFSTPLSFTASSQSPLNRLQVWILDHLHEDLDVAQLAARVNMSPRNFARAFARDFSMTPGEYLQRVRLEAARKWLEETDESIERIASRTGFGAASTLRRTFSRILKVNPDDYRDRFQRRDVR